MSEHEALRVFVGDWSAEGQSFGDENQTEENPHSGVTPWRSIHTARWHSGEFFVIQDERANGPFDTLSFLGWDPEAGRYFSRSIENHGFARNYTLTVDGDTWTFTGDQERATHTFTESGTRQDIHWERNVDGTWLPLCDRVAHRVELSSSGWGSDPDRP